MKFMRAIGIGALVWVLIFIEWSVIMFSPFLKDLGTWQWAIHYFVLIFIGMFCAWIYYKSDDRINGFALGIIFLVVGVILDALITVPLFIKSYSNYFLSPLLWAGFMELIVIVGVYDLVRK